MTNDELYNIIRPYFPEDIQFVTPYLDTKPQPNSEMAQINILDIKNVGWSQRVQGEYDEEKGEVVNNNYQLRVYTVQFDFYGKNSYDMCESLQRAFSTELVKSKNKKIGLKTIGNVDNRTRLLENKLYLKRYGFDAEFFIVDNYINKDSVIEDVKTKIVDRGNIF